MNTFAFVAILAVIVYFALIKSTFEIESGTFIYQKPASIYKAISDINTIAKFQPFVVSHTLLKTEKSPEGILTQYHTIEEHVPVVMNLTFPVIFNVKMEFTKPNKVLLFEYSIWYGTVVGEVTWEVKPRSGHHGPGAYLSYKAKITSPWVTSAFTEQRAKEAQDEILQQMRRAMETLQG